MRRILAALALPAAGLVAAILIPAGSGASFSGGEPYDGVVNGSTGAATIAVDCPGGVTDGFGTAKAGQTWGVIDAAGATVGTLDKKVNVTIVVEGALGPHDSFDNYGSKQIPSNGVLPCVGVAIAHFTSTGGSDDVAVTLVGTPS